MGAILEAILLGLVQGLTEFLPISSSGHVAIAMNLLGWNDPDSNLAFTIAVHLGSLGAVLVFSWPEILAMLTTRKRLLPVLVVATVPLAVIGMALKDVVADLAQNMFVVGGCLIFTGAMLNYARRRDRGDGQAAELSWGRAIAIGVAQAIAILPGVSRSGSTLAAGLTAGLDRGQAIRFAFLLAAPAIGGAGLLMVLDHENGAKLVTVPVLAGVVVSFLSSLVAMKVMVGVVEKRRLRWFALYCVCAGILAISLGLLHDAGAEDDRPAVGVVDDFFGFAGGG